MITLDPSTLRGDWHYPTEIRFGVGRVAELGAACVEAGMRHPLLVTDRFLAGTAIVATARDALAARGVRHGLFAEVRANPVGENVADGVDVFLRDGHDGVIALGGGSALDVGKAIAFMSGQSRPLWDFEDIGDQYRRANPAGIAPCVAVPTTAGTGSEVGRAAVITDVAQGVKRIIFHPGMLPRVVVADPALTVNLPPALTAAVGMDALSHSLEAYCATGFHPLADGIAVEAIRLIKVALPAAVSDGRDLAARAGMMAAAAMGATAFQKGLGAMHALSHPLGARLDLHHGLANAVVMPYVLRFNRAAIEDRLVRLARWLDLPGGDGGAVIDWVVDLRSAIGIPSNLATLGVEESMIPELARFAAADPSAGGNPVPLDAAALTGLYRSALLGR